MAVAATALRATLLLLVGTAAAEEAGSGDPAVSGETYTASLGTTCGALVATQRVGSDGCVPSNSAVRNVTGAPAGWHLGIGVSGTTNSCDSPEP